MNNPAIVKVAGREVARIEYRDEPVITFKMMDELHQRPEGAARKAFNNHKKKLVRVEDFHSVPFDVWSVLLNENGMDAETLFAGLAVNETDDQTARGGHRGNMTFLTQSGYLLLVKTFSDDLAWKVQRELVRAYFIAKRGGRGRKYDPEMERVKAIEREIKIVNTVHKRQDAVQKAVARIRAGKSTVEDYGHSPELLKEICAELEAARNARTPHAEAAERFVNAILEHGGGWEDRVDLRTDEGRLWFRMAPVLESLDALGIEFHREDVVPGLREMDGFISSRTHRFVKGKVKVSKKACVVRVPKGTEFGERKADQ